MTFKEWKSFQSSSDKQEMKYSIFIGNEWQPGAGSWGLGGPESSHLKPQANREWRGLRNPKASLSNASAMPFSRATPPEPTERTPATGDLVFRCWDCWDTSYTTVIAGFLVVVCICSSETRPQAAQAGLELLCPEASLSQVSQPFFHRAFRHWI